MTIELKTYDAAEYLRDEEDIRLYIEAAIADGDPAVIRNAIATAARCRTRAVRARRRQACP